VTPSQTLNVYVGQQGVGGFCCTTVAGGTNSGGGADGGTGSSGNGGSGGGGATDIRIGTALSGRLIVGGAGGGGSFDCGAGAGGAGGGLTGLTGTGCSSTPPTVGAPGTPSGGGVGGSGAGSGGLGFGGAGTNWGGGGGGGYYGGAGGYQGGGGGGSSYYGGVGVTGASTTPGSRAGNGICIITPLCSNPPASTGTMALCIAGSATLSNTVSGGTWASSNPGVATVTGSGTYTGVGTGTSTITYNVGGGCFSTVVVTVAVAPSVSSVTSNAPLCANNTLTLTASGAAGVSTYSWSGPAAITGGATAAASVPSITTGNTGTYSLTVSSAGTGPGCAVTYTTAVSVLAAPAAITGTASVCNTFTTALGEVTTGGTWTSTATGVATVGTSGIVTGVSPGTATISYTLGSGCAATVVATVNALPSLSITPSSSATICYNSSSTFTASAAGATFSWSGISGATGLSCTSCAAPAITPASLGSNVYSVTATSSAGCTTTSGVTVSVNPLPAAITGSSNVCVGTSTLLSGGTGGAWSSGSGNASVGISTGLVTGASVGAATISYTLPTSCYVTFAMNILPTPAAIGGTLSVCSGLTTNLTHAVSGGVWASSNAAIATVNPSGVVTGGTAGNAVISYTLPSGCTVLATTTVNALPAAISGTAAVCEASSVTLTDADAGGTWTSSSSNVSINSVSGVMTGVTAGNATITYTMPNTCYRTLAVVVNPRPAAITGTMSTCYNSISVLSDATAGGTWSSSNAAIAYVDASGVVTGIAPGVVTISYTLSTGCQRNGPFTVNALPAVIGGTLSVCQNDVTTLTDADGGGTWSSSNTSTATVNSSGDVTGVSAGNVTITYTLATGCRRLASVSVNALPLAISGTASTCEGSMTTLYDFSGGGTWTSGAPGVATVNSSGDVTGVTAGLVNITYQLPTGCMRTQIVSVNALPDVISGSGTVCVGQSTTLSDAISGGTWSSSTPGTATIDASGTVAGVSSGNTVITYMLSTGCQRTMTLTVNALPSTITGTATVCEGSTTSLNNGTPGGAWTSESDPTATVSGTGVVSGITAGNVFITYTLPTSCYRTRQVVVNPLPEAITGNTQVCVGQTTTMSDITPGGTWSSSAPGTAPVNSSGVVSGFAAGSGNISYTLPTGCRVSVAVAVNPLPNTITGPLSVCAGSTSTLNNASAGGTWESGNTGVAMISSSGVVSGISAGTSAITYTLPTGCMRTTNVNVNPLPSPIAGNLNVCQGMTSALGNSSTGGAWSTSAAGIASVNSSGVVTGVSAGTANITYTLPTTCRTASTVVVSPLPAAITGNTQVCAGSSTMLSNGTINGTWSSSTPGVAMVDVTGMVTGMGAGTATISYILPTGCYKTAVMNVNPVPAPIMGAASVCQGTGFTLTDASSGGTWSSSNTSVAMINGAGSVTGIAPGITAIYYTLPTGCSQSLTLNVDGIPAPIGGPGTVCAGSTIMLSTTSSGGFWSSATSVASVSFLGEVSGNTAGTAVITYMLPSGCQRTKTIVVNPLPSMISGNNNVCAGSMTTLSNGTSGGTWQSNSPALATVSATGGVVTGVSGGVALISYVLPTGCQRVYTMTVNATPASIGGVMEICNGGTTTLNTTTTGGVWISGNTSVAIIGLSGGNVTGLSAGTAQISYTLPTGCMSTATVMVNANPTPVIGTTSVCAGSGSVLSNATLGGIWNISNPSVATISGSGVLDGVTAGNTTVTYSLGTGCYTTAAVAVHSLPEVKGVTGGGSYCAGGSGIAVGLDGSQPLTTYKLYRSGEGLVGSFSGTGTPLFFGSIATAGMYTVSATNAMGCSSNMSGNAPVTITPVVTPVVSVSSSMGDTVCAGTSVTLGASVTNGGLTPTYDWKVNGVSMSTSGSYMYTPSNGDVISVTVGSSASCAIPAVVTGSKMMTVMSVQTPSAAISVGPSASVCKGTTVMFTVTPSNGGTAPTYTWVKNNTILMGTGTTLSYKPADNDVILCRLVSNYRCPLVNNVSSNSIVMNVDEVYIPEVEVVVTPGTTVHAADQVTFTATVTNGGPAPTYQWLKNGAVIGGATQPVYVGKNFSNGDSVTCMVHGSGACGEVTINSVMLTVLPSTGVATTHLGSSEVTLVPNPNNGRFVVMGSLGTTTDEEVQLEVTDMLGQVVYAHMVKAVNGKLNAEVSLGNNLANGMYLLNVGIGAERRSLHFVVKQ